MLLTGLLSYLSRTVGPMASPLPLIHMVGMALHASSIFFSGMAVIDMSGVSPCRRLVFLCSVKKFPCCTPIPLAVPSLLIKLSNLIASFLAARFLNSDHGVCYGENTPDARA